MNVGNYEPLYKYTMWRSHFQFVKLLGFTHRHRGNKSEEIAPLWSSLLLFHLEYSFMPCV